VADGSGPTGPTRPLRIGNCSGFYGDRLSAMREMLEGGPDDAPLDVLTGDYLAELTMLILGRDTLKDPDLGYARTFVTQLEDCLGLALERGTRLVANAGGLNPAGLAERVREVAKGLGLDPQVAHVEGDDLRARAAELGIADNALTVNAYLGGLGIATALRVGADVVVTGRVTDASLVVGPAVAHHDWSPTAHHRLAGAVVAGHVLECGPQATGGNFSGFATLPHRDRPLGFPLAEIAADGTSVITKHAGTGGAVTVDTVTAQLVYEIQSARYLNPDVTTCLDSASLRQVGEDRVEISGVRGEAPPERLKVCVNELGGFRNTAEFVLTGLDVDAKAAWLRAQLEPRIGAAEVSWTLTTRPRPDAPTEEAASCLLRVTAKDPRPEPVGRAFTGPAVELALASYPGFTMTGPPAQPTPYGVYRAAYVDRSAVTHTVVHADGRREVVAEPAAYGPTGPTVAAPSAGPGPAPPAGPTRRLPLGTFVHARSGDKGGDANLGLWVAHEQDGAVVPEERYAARVAWLTALVTPQWVRELVPEAGGLEVEVFALPNLGGVNVLLHGLLGDGVAASTRFDPQAKALGEWVRSRHVDVPEELL
jgi:hypothetical protein